MDMYTKNEPIIDKVASNLYLIDINEKSFELGRWPYETQAWVDLESL